jgi:hypothetical protein
LKNLAGLIVLFESFFTGAIVAADYAQAELPLKKVVLFSSGVAYYERAAEIDGKTRALLHFDRAQMDDALKSLVIYDPAGKSPFASYENSSSEGKINFQGGLLSLFEKMRGEEVEISGKTTFKGKILAVERKILALSDGTREEAVVTLFGAGKAAHFPLSEIEGARFTDPKINAEIEKSLAALKNGGDLSPSTIEIFLDGEKRRAARVSYVLAAPVWKANYRLDLGGKTPFLQSWAIIDNAGDSDWVNVQLTLAIGRITSFTQPYFAPFYTSRPALPLSIEGFASARQFDSGYGGYLDREVPMAMEEVAERKMMMKAPTPRPSSDFAENDAYYYEKESAESLQGYANAESKRVGEQFTYKIGSDVTLQRKKSAMAPLASGEIAGRKISIFSADQRLNSEENPSLGAEITNTLNSPLPAGSIAIFDGGSYAGDALLKFFPQGEKRLISYGDDLLVRGFKTYSARRVIDSVKISKGVMKISRKITHKNEYLFKNSADYEKTLILEQNYARNSKLAEPENYLEKTDRAYRFEIILPAKQEKSFAVAEVDSNIDQLVLIGAPFNTIAIYAGDPDMPPEARKKLKEAENLAAKIWSFENAAANAQRKIKMLETDQTRVRENLKAVGSTTDFGSRYASELQSLDAQIKAAQQELNRAMDSKNQAQKDYDDFVAKIEI